ncbi:hypothetical protein D3C74_388020 [compost metagenome]
MKYLLPPNAYIFPFKATALIAFNATGKFFNLTQASVDILYFSTVGTISLLFAPSITYILLSIRTEAAQERASNILAAVVHVLVFVS